MRSPSFRAAEKHPQARVPFRKWRENLKMTTGCRGRIRTGGLKVMSLASYHCSTLPYAPCGASFSAQYARLKAYPSLRTVVEEAGFAPARRPVSAPGTAGRTMQPASAFAILPYFPPRCCRTGKNGGCEEEDRGPLFHPASSRYLFYTVSRFALGKYLWQV